MRFTELTVETTEAGAEIVTARLDMLGISQVNIIQGHDEIEAVLNKIKGYWDYADEEVLNKQPSVKAYIPNTGDESVSGKAENGITGKIKISEEAVRASMAELKRMEKELGIDLGSLSVTAKQIAEEDWANNWKAYFKPMPVGEKLLICPSWESVPAGNKRIVLKIDPGSAFGTGSHQTTRMCLELLEKYMQKGLTVIDLGCGSGILSIGALLLGASEAWAVDMDSAAVKAASANAGLNGIDAEKYFICTGDILGDKAFKAKLAGGKYDIVLANIVSDVLIAFAPGAYGLMKNGGVLIASGIIESRLDEVVSAFRENRLGVLEILTDNDWRAVAVKKA